MLKKIQILLFFTVFTFIVNAQSINFQTLGTWNSQGLPDYLVSPSDVIPQDFLERVRATLPESKKLTVSNPEYFTDSVVTNLIILQEADVFVTFVTEGAGYRNSLGFYTYNVNNPPQTVADIQSSMTLIFPNSSLLHSGGELKPGMKVKIGRFQPGTVVGWFVVADGFKSGNISNGHWILYSNKNLNTIITDTAKRQHSILLNDFGSGRFLLAFEDVRRDYNSSDLDFNDVVFYATSNPVTAINLSNVPFVQPGANDTYANLSVTKTVNNEFPADGEEVTFNITATNNGPNGATNVKIKDLLPLGINYTASLVSTGTYDNNSGIWEIDNLINGASATLTLKGTVSIISISQAAFDLGPAVDFNVFCLKDMSQPSADTEGRVAVGRDAYFSNYSIGDKLPNSQGAVDVLVVGRNLTFISGAVFSGNVVYGGASNLPINQVSYVDGTLRQDSIIDFNAAEAYMLSLSDQLSAYPANGSVIWENSGLTLNGGDPFLNVFDVKGSMLSRATSFTLSVPNGSVVLVNIDSNSVKWSGGAVINGTANSNVLYNFFEAEGVRITQIDVLGTILAPRATLDYPGGVINGQVIAKNIYGPGQFNSGNYQEKYFSGTLPATRSILNSAQILSLDQIDLDTSNNLATASITLGGYGDPINTGNANWQITGTGTTGTGELIWTSAFDVNGHLLIGTWGGKIYRTTNQGEDWILLNQGMPVAYLWDLLIDGNSIYAATERGIYLSIDNGNSWNELGLNTFDIRALAKKNNRIFAGSWGGGMFYSDNNGVNWTNSSAGLTFNAVTSLAIASNGRVFAGTFQGGLNHSDDNGATWVKTNLTYQHIWSLGIASNGTIYAGTYGGGVYRSINNGTSFSAINNNLLSNHIYSITFDNQDNVFVSAFAGGVYALQTNVFDNSEDIWMYTGLGGLEVTTVIYDFNQSKLLATSTNGNLYVNSNPLTSVKNNGEVTPGTYSLGLNYPNPFNPETVIEFSIPVTHNVKITVYDILGKEVSVIVNGELTQGNHKVSFSGKGLSSGIYFYRMEAGVFSDVKRMILLK